MAIGARILSNNLNGKTVNVTFFPTTGGTVNLGSQTIPFNNITPYPYGLYQIYVPEYDYTYELTINATATDGKSFSFVSKLITDNNYGTAILSYNLFTAEIIGFGVDSTGWYINDLMPITNGGYGYHFQNENTCNLQWMIFTDSLGNVLDSYQVDCDCDYDYGDMGGKWIYFADYKNCVLKYFNGFDVFTLTGDSSYQYIDAEWNWDGVTSTDNFIVSIDNYTASTRNYYTTTGSTLIQIGDTYNYLNEWTSAQAYFDGSFILITKYDGIQYKWDSFKIYDAATGNLLQTLDLTTYGNLNCMDTYRYGNNKFFTVIWNCGDNSIDYVIVQYNGNTNVLNVETHDKINYPYFAVSSNRNLYPNDGGSDAFSVVLFNETGYIDLGSVVSYVDIIYMLSGDTTIQTYQFQNSGIGNKTMRVWCSVSDNIFTNCDNGDGFVSILSITNSGVNYTNTNLLMSNNPATDYTITCGNKYVATLFENNSRDLMTLVHILEDGTLGGLINGVGLTGAYQKQVYYAGDVFLFHNYSGDCYYVNSMSPSFQPGPVTGNTINSYWPSPRFRDDFRRPGLILFADYVSKEYCVLSATGMSSLQPMPANTNFEFRLGDNRFLLTFIDDVSGLTNYHLYDYSFNLINSATTEFTSYWGNYSCGDNFVGIINENNRYYLYLITQLFINSTSITDYNDYYTFNDYVFWD